MSLLTRQRPSQLRSGITLSWRRSRWPVCGLSKSFAITCGDGDLLSVQTIRRSVPSSVPKVLIVSDVEWRVGKPASSSTHLMSSTSGRIATSSLMVSLDYRWSRPGGQTTTAFRSPLCRWLQQFLRRSSVTPRRRTRSSMQFEHMWLAGGPAVSGMWTLRRCVFTTCGTSCLSTARCFSEATVW